MKLPLLLSIPHAGLEVPVEAAADCALTPRQIEEDGDEGAAEIYALADEVARFVTTPIARAIVDLNRAEDDRRKDGIVKTHTCWDVPVWSRPLSPDLAEKLIDRYHRPYHRQLRDLAGRGVVCGIDGHTMAAFGPPVGPDPGVERPRACLGNADGTCPDPWLETLAACLRETLGDPVTINEPFRGGYITRTHAAEMPWLQLELSRAAFLTNAEKRGALLAALRAWCDRMAFTSNRQA